jgi:hypothetical protein
MFDLTILSRHARDLTEAQFGAAREGRRGPAAARRVRRARKGTDGS